MLNKNTLTAFLFGLSISALAQTQTFNPFFFGNDEQTSKVNPVNITTQGEQYFDNNWNAGKIYLTNGDSLIAYYVKYDIIKNNLEIILDKKIQGINGRLIKSFEWFSFTTLQLERFVNKNSLGLGDQSDIPLFTQVLVEGETQLIKSKKIFAPNNSLGPSLVLDNEQKIMTEPEYFLITDGDLFEIKNSKRKNLKKLNSSELAKYVNNNNLKFNQERDLVSIIEFYNNI